MIIRHTERGFQIATFADGYDQACSVQESSNEGHLWLGLQGYRMHLSSAQIAELLPLLQQFVETGKLK